MDKVLYTEREMSLIDPKPGTAAAAARDFGIERERHRLGRSVKGEISGRRVLRGHAVSRNGAEVDG